MILNINFEQGSASSDSQYQIRSGYIRANPAEKVVISADSTTGKAIQVELIGYSEPDTTKIFDLNWYDIPHTFDISNRSSVKYLKVIIKYKDGKKITPEEISCNLEINYSWYTDENGDLHCYDMPYAPEKSISSPYPSALWRIDYLSPNMPYHKLLPNIKAINMWSLPHENVIRVYDYREKQDGFKHNGLAILAPSECIEYHELNGRWDVELTHPLDDWGRWKTILPQNVLKIDGQLFRIDEHTSVSGTSGMYIKVHAKHISYDLADEFVHYYQGENLNGYEFIRAMFGACLTDKDHYDKYSFQYNSDIENRTGQFEITDKSLLNALIGGDDCLINQLGGELYRDNFYFSINNRMEGAKDNAFALKYGFDMVEISQKIDYSEFATWLMVDDNYGDSWAVSYVNNVYPIHHHKHIFKRFSYSSSENSYERMVRDAQNLFGELCRPKVTYEVNIASMKNNPKYSDFLNLQNYRLGDKGTIECELLDIKTTQEIIAVETDRLTGDIRKIKLGNENYSIIRPSYKSGNISGGISSAETALQNQITELSFREYITTPVVTIYNEYIVTKNNEYLLYKE